MFNRMRESLASAVINRNYGLFLGGSFVSGLGSWLLTVAFGWLVLQLGNSDFLLGVANFAQMAPLLVLGAVGGAVSDRIDRRKLLLLTQFISFLASSGLAVLAVLDRLTIPALMITALVTGLANAFMWPAWSAFIKDLVGPEHLRNAVATNSARFNLTRVLGPALGGAVLAQFGPAPCLIIGSASTLGVMTALLFIHVAPEARSRALRWKDMVTRGFSYSWQHVDVRNVLLVTAVIAIFGSSYQTFLPAFAAIVLKIGPTGYGYELGAVGIGAILGALVSGQRWVARRPDVAMFVMLGVAGLGLVGFGATSAPAVALPMLAIVGFSTIAFLSTANASVQLAVPNEIVGSVMGVWVVVNSGLIPVGSLIVGKAADEWGVSLSILVCGLVCLVVSLPLLFHQARQHVLRKPVLVASAGGQSITMPPLTSSISPVTKPPSSEAR
jgi:MFS family permease